jgi:hypothetical protein
MRFVVALCMLVGVAGADPGALAKQYAGRIVISPDSPPTTQGELADYVKANAVAGDRYELIKGAPWGLNLVGFLAKEPGAPTVQLVIAELGKDKELVRLDVRATNRVVITSSKLTAAAGFEDNKSYAVRLVKGTTVLAKAELKLRP